MTQEQNNNQPVSTQLLKNTYKSFTITEKEILSYLVKKIKPTKNTLTIKLNIQSLINIFNKQKKLNFKKIMMSLEDLDDKSFYIKKSKEHYDLWRWLTDVSAMPTDNNSGYFIISFNPKLKKYLETNLLSFKKLRQFSDVLPMKSHYGILLFKILIHNLHDHNSTSKKYSLKKLRSLLSLNNKSKTVYPNFADFKRRVLEPAVNEINQFTDYNVTTNISVTKGAFNNLKYRKVKAINFTMSKKKL